ncbi:MAG: type II secretion system protein [Chlamydiales bacterium]|nr:type II secretion system protein [Chlamydiales bacterium]
MQKRKKQPLTLLEIMIVIFLIGLIGSVIGYNMKGSLDEGRYFKTEQSAKQIRELLLLEVAKGASIDDVVSDPEFYLRKTGIVKDAKKILKDGWDNPFKIEKKYTDDIKVTTAKFTEMRSKKNKKHDGKEKADSEDGDEG